ncbi:hypothetical protein KO481_41680 [Nocardia sp. NEAU-G5]|uniref:Uncharacterized protein n=1 Tax=Nocardia albiluteola TaxID=2842303 RepID=A0ABS6BCJ8_9NOCA|nr:hypothetical protein [Nocardia albiluteola]MBU3068013.1 hypothetical protein [Nocardia albiluteola]
MADGSNPAPTGPLASLITDAQNGALTVSFGNGLKKDFRLNADEFAYIERDCIAFKKVIRELQSTATDIANRTDWGLGESNPKLPSAGTVVSRFRSKAANAGLPTDSDDNLHDILDQHYQIVDDIQTLHHTIAQQFCQQDAHFAAEYNTKMANLEPSPIGTPMQVGVTTNPGLGLSK